MRPRVEVGQRWRYMGEGSEFFTHGKEYAVTQRGDGNWFQIDDDKSGRHNWQDEPKFLGLFEFVCDPALPVRTRTVTEIIPGEYDGILISEPGDYAVFIRMHIEDHGKFYSAKALREAGRLFKSLAEALEETS